MTLAIEEEEIIGKENYILKIKDNLDLIPCSLELSGIEMGLVNVMSRELILKSIIEEIEKDYDYILVIELESNYMNRFIKVKNRMNSLKLMI